MNRRRELRVRRRFSCKVDGGERQQVGVILHLSQHGLFVQTRFQLRDNARIPLRVDFELPTRGALLSLSAEVIRQYRVPAALFASAGGGLGLCIRHAPDAWPDFVASLSPNQQLARRDAPTELLPKPTAPTCLLCGRAPVAGTSLCTRCCAEPQTA